MTMSNLFNYKFPLFVVNFYTISQIITHNIKSYLHGINPNARNFSLHVVA